MPANLSKPIACLYYKVTVLLGSYSGTEPGLKKCHFAGLKNLVVEAYKKSFHYELDNASRVLTNQKRPQWSCTERRRNLAAATIPHQVFGIGISMCACELSKRKTKLNTYLYSFTTVFLGIWPLICCSIPGSQAKTLRPCKS